MLKAINIWICDGKGCVLFPVSLSLPSKVPNSTMRIRVVTHPLFDVASCYTLLHTKSIRQLESIKVPCVLAWKNINLAVCLKSPACFMPLFTWFFNLAARCSVGTNISLSSAVNRSSLNSLVGTLRVQSTRGWRAEGMNLHKNPYKMLFPIWFPRLEYPKGLSDSKTSLISKRNV